MAILGLDIPTEVRWERICVTRDMMDQDPCDDRLPPKWHSSIAVFKYVPEDEYQLYPGRKLTYLKVTCTLCGYQPVNSEVGGSIDWNGVHEAPVPHLDELLSTYLPCNEALIQVTVGPPSKAEVSSDDYPYFMDFQPKKRELYEMATDTNEHMSRSTEQVNLRKAAGTTEGQEVLDVDQGTSVGGQASYMGTGGGFSYSQQGQWGAKRMSNIEGNLTSTADQSRERREEESHTTQISQLYHLLDNYHLGTNRALFFVQARPHTLQQPSGFVRGPREVEGIQEIFLAVNQPKDQADLCVSVRVDTGHLTEAEVLGYDLSKTDTLSVSASAPAPLKDDPDKEPAGETSLQFIDPITRQYRSGAAIYLCYVRRDMHVATYHPSERFPDYKIDLRRGLGGYTDLSYPPPRNGRVTVDVSPDGEALTMTAGAVGHACFWNYNTELALGAPDTTDVFPGSAYREVLIYLISREPTVSLGKQRVMVVTTRGLCCCPGEEGHHVGLFERDRIVGIVDLGALSQGRSMSQQSYAAPRPSSGNIPASREQQADSLPQPMIKPTEQIQVGQIQDASLAGATAETKGQGFPEAFVDAITRPSNTMTAQEANALSSAMRNSLLRVVSSPPGRARLAMLTAEYDFVSSHLHTKLKQSEAGRALLRRPLQEAAPAEVVAAASKFLSKEPDKVTRGDLAALATQQLASIAGLDARAAGRFRLSLLGVPLQTSPTSEIGKEPKAGAEGQN